MFDCEIELGKLVSASLRAGGLCANKSTSLARQRRRALRLFGWRRLDKVKTSGNNYISADIHHDHRHGNRFVGAEDF